MPYTNSLTIQVARLKGMASLIYGGIYYKSNYAHMRDSAAVLAIRLPGGRGKGGGTAAATGTVNRTHRMLTQYLTLTLTLTLTHRMLTQYLTRPIPNALY